MYVKGKYDKKYSRINAKKRWPRIWGEWSRSGLWTHLLAFTGAQKVADFWPIGPFSHLHSRWSVSLRKLHSSCRIISVGWEWDSVLRYLMRDHCNSLHLFMARPCHLPPHPASLWGVHSPPPCPLPSLVSDPLAFASFPPPSSSFATTFSLFGCSETPGKEANLKHDTEVFHYLEPERSLIQLFGLVWVAFHFRFPLKIWNFICGHNFFFFVSLFNLGNKLHFRKLVVVSKRISGLEEAMRIQRYVICVIGMGHWEPFSCKCNLFC